VQESLLFIAWYVLYVCVVLFGGRFVPALATTWVDHAHDGGAIAGAAAGAGGGGGGGALRLVAADVEMATLSPGREGAGGGGGGADGGGGNGEGGGAPTAADGHRIDTRRGRTAEQRVALSTSVKRAARAGAAGGGSGLRGDGDGHDSGDEAPDRALPPSRAAAAWAAAESANGGGASSSGNSSSSHAAAVSPTSGDPGSGSSGAGAGASDEPQTYPQQLRTWAITYSGIRDPHVMRWALPFTAPVRLALSLTMVRSFSHARCMPRSMPRARL
jgi:hypothetical protein